jgi:hypothetical protein
MTIVNPLKRKTTISIVVGWVAMLVSVGMMR